MRAERSAPKPALRALIGGVEGDDDDDAGLSRDPADRDQPDPGPMVKVGRVPGTSRSSVSSSRDSRSVPSSTGPKTFSPTGDLSGGHDHAMLGRKRPSRLLDGDSGHGRAGR